MIRIIKCPRTSSVRKNDADGREDLKVGEDMLCLGIKDLSVGVDLGNILVTLDALVHVSIQSVRGQVPGLGGSRHADVVRYHDWEDQGMQMWSGTMPGRTKACRCGELWRAMYM
jgi:hypothetical protein